MMGSLLFLATKNERLKAFLLCEETICSYCKLTLSDTRHKNNVVHKYQTGTRQRCPTVR